MVELRGIGDMGHIFLAQKPIMKESGQVKCTVTVITVTVIP